MEPDALPVIRRRDAAGGRYGLTVNGEARPVDVDYLRTHLARIGHGIALRESTIAGAGTGAFVTRAYREGEFVTFYAGWLLSRARFDAGPAAWRSHARALILLEWVIVGSHDEEGHEIEDPARSRVGAGAGAYCNDARDEARNNVEYMSVDSPANQARIFAPTHTPLLPAERLIVLRATRDLAPGDEIFVSYGDNYWARVEPERNTADKLGPSGKRDAEDVGGIFRRNRFKRYGCLLCDRDLGADATRATFCGVACRATHAALYSANERERGR